MKRYPSFSKILNAGLLVGASLLPLLPVAHAQEKGLSNHGIAVPVSTSRGSIVVKAADEKEKLLVLLNDHSGSNGLVLIDPDNGKADYFALPYETWDSAFHVLYSKAGKLYSQYGGYFFEFDPRLGKFTHVEKVGDRAAMSMTEGDDGVVWMGTYPKAHIMSFDPKSREFKDYGQVNQEDWPQYPRLMAADDQGWVYTQIAFTHNQILGLNPKTGQVVKFVPEQERVGGSIDARVNTHTPGRNGTLWRGVDGKVYARMPGGAGPDWFRLHGGKAERFSENPTVERQFEFSESQLGAIYHKFSDGREVMELDVPAGTLAVLDTDGGLRRLKFEYPSKGAIIASIYIGPDNRVYGSTGHPLNLFSYDPQDDSLTRAAQSQGGHINALTPMGDKLYGAIYTQGVIVEYDPQTQHGTPTHLQVKRLDQAGETVLRPFDLKPYRDGESLLLVGSPGYGRTGGGMMIYNVKSGEKLVIPDTEILENHSTKAIAVLPDGNLIGGTSIEPGTGGKILAKEAELYIMQMPEREIIYRSAIIPKQGQIRELMVDGDLVYGLSGDGGMAKGDDFVYGKNGTFFVFDWKKRELLHQERLSEHYGDLTGGQAPRVWAMGEDGMIYCLFKHHIVQIDPKTYKHTSLVKLPGSAFAGIALVDGSLYFSIGSELWSYKLPYSSQPD